MVDSARAYRRWLRRRLLILGPAFLAALGLSLFIVLDHQAALWLRIPCVSVALALAGLLGYLGAQTARTFWHSRDGQRRSARVLRRELKSYRALTLGAVAVLSTVVLAPLVLPQRSFSPSTFAVRRPSRSILSLRVLPDPFVGELQPEPLPGPVEPAVATSPVRAPEERRPASVSSPEPEIKPVIAALPQSLVLDERDLQAPAVARVTAAPGQDPDPGDLEELHRMPRFRRGAEDLFPAPWTSLVAGMIDRLGQPEEWNVFEAPSPEIRCELMMGTSGMHWEGNALEVGIDVALTRLDLFRAAAWMSHLTRDDSLGGESHLTWQRVTLEYLRRLAGYTRHSPFDLAVSFGMNADYVDSPGAGVSVHTGVGLSASVGFEAALWYAGTYGFLVHVGQSIPLGVTDFSAGVTDVSATVRVDITESLSLHAGYRIFWFKLHSGTESLVNSDTRGWVAGPVIGFDLRF